MKRQKWGNSLLAVNYHNRLCDYCGNLIGDNKWFLIRLYDGRKKAHEEYKSLCSRTCEMGMDIRWRAKKD